MIVTLSLDFILENVVELVASPIWIFITGSADFSNAATLAHIDLYVFMRLFGAMVTFALTFFMASLIRRFTPEEERAAENGGHLKNTQFRYFSGLLTVQALILLVLCPLFGQSENIVAASWAFICALCILVLFVALDLTLFVFLGRHQEQTLADLAIQELQNRSNATAERSQEILSKVEHISRIRHDARNTVAVAREMQSHGRSDEARALLEKLQREVHAS